jgi:hypothetical protein
MGIAVHFPAEQGALVVQSIHAAAGPQRRERDGADREQEMPADVSAETPDVLIPCSNSCDDAESPVFG